MHPLSLTPLIDATGTEWLIGPVYLSAECAFRSRVFVVRQGAFQILEIASPPDQLSIEEILHALSRQIGYTVHLGQDACEPTSASRTFPVRHARST